MSGSLIHTKLAIPQSQRMVDRPRLREALDRLMDRRLALVSAPAGFGKSTAVADWIRVSGQAAGWVTLDPGDNDVARFLAYFTEALRGPAPRAAAAARQILEGTHHIAVEPVLAVLVNGTRGLTHDFLLVLDDYHVIGEQAVHDAMTFLLERLPPRVHLLIATRADPPLQLARLRSRDQIVELRSYDLRFTPSESETFFNSLMGLELHAVDVQTLASRTDGWIAGMRLAASSLRASGDASEYVRRFGGSERHIMEYLSEEVLRRLPEATQSFLMRTSIAEQLCGSLCQALTGLADSAAILRRVETEGLFVEALDAQRSWYRYHPLFADILRLRLERQAPGDIEGLHRRASAWYAENGMTEEAIDHAIAGKDWAKAAPLIQAVSDDLIMHCQAATFLRWTEALPAGERVRFPLLCVLGAEARIMVGRPFADVQQAMKEAEDCGGAASVSAELAAVKSFIAYLMQQPRESLSLARKAIAGLSEESHFLHSTVQGILGVLSLSAGDTETAEHNLEMSIRDARRAGNHYALTGAYNKLAILAIMRGRLQEAERQCHEALEFSADGKGGLFPVAAEPLLQMAKIAFERNDLDGAEARLAEASASAADWTASSRVECRSFAARLASAKGDFADAQAQGRLARELAAKFEVTEIDDRMVEADHAELEIQAGRIEEAVRWAQARGIENELARLRDKGAEPQSYHTVHEREHLVFARLELARGRSGEALEVARLLQGEAEAKGLSRSLLYILLVASLALDALGRKEEALETLTRTLEIAEREGFVRAFVEAGVPMARLLDDAARRGIHVACVGRLLAAFPSAADPIRNALDSDSSRPMVEPLSPREIEILKLLSEGLSNKEIADRGFIALQTVKWHTSNIYAKLGVKSRTQAVARARGLGIVPSK